MLTDAMHEGGSKAFIQLNHAGSSGVGDSVRLHACFCQNSFDDIS